MQIKKCKNDEKSWKIDKKKANFLKVKLIK